LDEPARDPFEARAHRLTLVVFSVTEQDRYAEVLTRLQAPLAMLSSDTGHVTVAGATHYTLVSERN